LEILFCDIPTVALEGNIAEEDSNQELKRTRLYIFNIKKTCIN